MLTFVKGKVQILVKLNSLPEIVSYGEGETELEAKYDAAANLLELIDLADEQNGDDKEISAQ